jgi:biopolymer transport protein ExbB
MSSVFQFSDKYTAAPKASRRLLPLLLTTLLGVSAQAHAWWSDDWAFRKPITLDAKAAGVTGEQTNVPVLIRLHEGVLKFTDVAADGADIRFVAEDDKTPLKYHIEKFDPIFNLGFVWVQVPKVEANKPVKIWMYYGNAKATAESNSKDSYDANQVLVYHFGEKGSPATDATSYRNNATNASAIDESGLIGNSARFDGSASLNLPATASIPAGSGLTWSAWVKPTAAETSVIYAQRGANSLVVGLNNGAPYVSIDNAASPLSAQIADNSWHHLAVVANATQTTLYVDGQVRSTLAHGLAAGLQGAATLGGDGAQQPFHGEVDELKLAKVARDAGAIQLEAGNQGTTDKLIQFGTDEAASSGSTGYFGVIMASVTIDGWVVIGVLIVMMLISWAVMTLKGLQIGRASKANNAFLDAFKQVKGDFVQLHQATIPNGESTLKLDEDTLELMQDAPLMHIFHTGIDELHDRLHTDPRTGRPLRVLSTQSIEAIRATLNSALVRETQSLNKQMVLLTIAISGGPFIGLLGTVVGVMITFAAVAAAGEVNVNAIAPGISAALAATVAGLFVAIPALFGYNYLLTRVKECSTEMHMFIESFITRMAENYNNPAVLHAMSDD